jgi:predicted DNA-binding protein (MmcQ/YjbR family)
VTPKQFNAFCKSLPHSTHVNQWGGADVWKVGGKMFAVHFPPPDKWAGITFKTSPMSYELLRTQPGLRPAPYLASRGMKWIQWHSDESMGEKDLKAYLKQSYELVFEGLPKKFRTEMTADRN